MNFFQHQDNARKHTRQLVLLFSLAVLSLIIMTNLLIVVVFGYFNPEKFSSLTAAQAAMVAIDWHMFLVIGAAVTTVILIGSLYKIISLSGGGARVAEMMDGKLVLDSDNDINKQKLLNVVAEMAIASGTPVPPVYLIEEDGINAFAAGYAPGDAVIGVTRGAIENLSREQLQGVIAHEFSHIFNGDMKLNIRLIGLLHGILLIGLIGYYILRSTSRSRRSKDSGGIALLGLGLVVIGYSGTFFGNLIKAAVSRQREYLADASAVQFTRNPEGIAGALKRIGGHASGSIIQNPAGSQISHALFSQGIKTAFTGMFATHPPLEKRISRIQPDWDGEFDYSPPEETVHKPVDKAEGGHARQQATTATMAVIAAAMTSGEILNDIGQPGPKQLQYAQGLLNDLPAAFKTALHDPYAARAVIYYLLLDTDSNIRKHQLGYLQTAADKGVYEEVIKLVNVSESPAIEYRLPLVDMALATLHQLSKNQYVLFKNNLDKLVEIDNKLSLYEWSLRKIIIHYLDPVFNEMPQRRSDRLALKQAKNACAVLLSVLTYTGKQQGISNDDAFNAAASLLGMPDILLVPKNEIKLNKLNDSLDQLAQLKPLEKPQLLKACAACITSDQNISANEIELFRAIAAILDCPMPPLIIE